MKNILLQTILRVCVIMWLVSNEKRKGMYIQVNVYNQMKEIFIKDWKDKRLLGIYSNEDIPSLTDHWISQRNIKFEICTRQLWNDM